MTLNQSSSESRRARRQQIARNRASARAASQWRQERRIREDLRINHGLTPHEIQRHIESLRNSNTDFMHRPQFMAQAQPADIDNNNNLLRRNNSRNNNVNVVTQPSQHLHF